MTTTHKKFVNIVKEHLSQYKNNVLHISVNGKYKDGEYGHILPKENKSLNILPSSFYDEIIGEIDKVKLHQFFPHLNSSQALCFNLFYPLLLSKDTKNLSEIFNDKIDQIIEYKFEFIQDKAENTNFDLYIKTNFQNYYFEIKYTENSFGAVRADDKHVAKYNKIYKNKLARFPNVTQDIFFANYQIFRNAIYVNTGIVLFVVPEKRGDLKNKIEEVKQKYCNNDANIRIMAIENILDKISGNDAINEHYKMFRKKYIV